VLILIGFADQQQLMYRIVALLLYNGLFLLVARRLAIGCWIALEDLAIFKLGLCHETT